MELRFKQLEKAKAYRDMLLGSGEIFLGPRKRVIIAPSMVTATEKDGNIHSLPAVTRKTGLKEVEELTDSTHINGVYIKKPLCIGFNLGNVINLKIP